ncbi:MAG: DUF5640 domain-containing protein, partial [Eubacteriales bacterium]|nr:DUF5640 domain-containing protein [Eubacteriales bacterium]
MKKIKKSMALIAVLSFILIFYGCGKTSIIGKWSVTKPEESEVSYTFEDGGNGVYNEGEISLSMSYKAENDKLTISVPYLGQTKETTYNYKIK